MVALTAASGKTITARPWLQELQPVVGQLALGVADLLVLASALAITKPSPATPLDTLLGVPGASRATLHWPMPPP